MAFNRREMVAGVLASTYAASACARPVPPLAKVQSVPEVADHPVTWRPVPLQRRLAFRRWLISDLNAGGETRDPANLVRRIGDTSIWFTLGRNTLASINQEGIFARHASPSGNIDGLGYREFDDTLWVTDAANDSISAFKPGSGFGPAVSVRCDKPSRFAFDLVGNIFVFGPSAYFSKINRQREEGHFYGWQRPLHGAVDHSGSLWCLGATSLFRPDYDTSGPNGGLRILLRPSIYPTPLIAGHGDLWFSHESYLYRFTTDLVLVRYYVGGPITALTPSTIDETMWFVFNGGQIGNIDKDGSAFTQALGSAADNIYVHDICSGIDGKIWTAEISPARMSVGSFA